MVTVQPEKDLEQQEQEICFVCCESIIPDQETVKNNCKTCTGSTGTLHKWCQEKLLKSGFNTHTCCVCRRRLADPIQHVAITVNVPINVVVPTVRRRHGLVEEPERWTPGCVCCRVTKFTMAIAFVFALIIAAGYLGKFVDIVLTYNTHTEEFWNFHHLLIGTITLVIVCMCCGLCHYLVNPEL